MATEIASCHRCGSQPALERMGAYWRLKCLGHATLPAYSVIGHTMKTKSSAIAEWNRMNEAAAIRGQGKEG